MQYCFVIFIRTIAVYRIFEIDDGTNCPNGFYDFVT